jgi:hypothetical protein
MRCLDIVLITILAFDGGVGSFVILLLESVTGSNIGRMIDISVHHYFGA